MQGKEELSNNTVDALCEFANIGAGNAATSLSVLLGSKLSISEPTVEVLNFDELVGILGGPEESVVGTLSKLNGNVEGSILFVMGIDDAKKLVNQLVDNNDAWDSDLGISAVKEISNILIGSYVSSLETLTNSKMRIAQPEICIDMAGAILGVTTLELGIECDTALLIDSEIKAGDLAINGIIMLITEPDSFDNVLKSMGVNINNE